MGKINFSDLWLALFPSFYLMQSLILSVPQRRLTVIMNISPGVSRERECRTH